MINIDLNFKKISRKIILSDIKSCQPFEYVHPAFSEESRSKKEEQKHNNRINFHLFFFFHFSVKLI